MCTTIFLRAIAGLLHPKKPEPATITIAATTTAATTSTTSVKVAAAASWDQASEQRELEIVEDLKLLFRGGADSMLPLLFDRTQVVFELFYLIRINKVGAGTHLLRLLLEHGLDPNFAYNYDNDYPPPPLYEGDIFVDCMNHSSNMVLHTRNPCISVIITAK